MLQLHSIPTDAAAPCSRRNASKLQTRSLILYSALRALRGMKRSITFEKNVPMHNVKFLRTDAICRLTTSDYYILLIFNVNKESFKGRKKNEKKRKNLIKCSQLFTTINYILLLNYSRNKHNVVYNNFNFFKL